MIDCPNGEIRDQLPDYLHEQLPAPIRARITAHVATCDACSAELALLRELHGSIQAAPTVDVRKIVAALPSPSLRMATTAGPTRRRYLDWRVAASIAVLAVGGGAAAVLSGRPDIVPSPDSPAATRQIAVMPVIESYVSDASTVELEALLDDLESFDGLPPDEPEMAAPVSGDAEEGL
jgi:anti-sigma factor RsiW